jgi:hydroxymethylpyrimidine/phosphomethylpyrimidine kinase
MVVIAVGGIDPTGRSGLAADLRTLVLCGAHGAPVVSALTVQDPSGVRKVMATSPADLEAMFVAARTSLPVTAVKIGMIVDAAQARALVAVLPEGVPVVVDPVLEASAGGALASGPEAYGPLLARTTLLTPNKSEALALLGSEAPEVWVARTGVSLLLKDGHGEDWEVVDRLLTPESDPRVWRHPRLDVTNTRGTGCTLASGIAAGLANALPMADAVENALTLVDQLLRRSDGIAIGEGAGPLLHHGLVRR